MTPIKWDEVIERANKSRFGDIQNDRIHCIQRGPVKKIYRNGHKIVFETIWMARQDRPRSEWQNLYSAGFTINDGCKPFIKKDGTLYFNIPNVGEVQIFPKHTNELDPSEIIGLEGDEVRQSRAWMYDIPLDSDWKAIVDRVVNDLGADGLTSPHDQVRIQDEAAHFA